MMRALCLLVAAAAGFAVAQTPPGHLGNPYGPVVKWRTIAQGDSSKIMREEARMINGDADWSRVYREMMGIRPGDQCEVPQVADWNREDLLILHLGRRRTSGYGIYVETIGRSATGYYDIHYVMQEPMPGVQMDRATTSPFVIIAIEKTVGTPRYFGRTATMSVGFISGGCSCGSKPIIMVGAGGKVIPLGTTGGKCSKCGGRLGTGGGEDEKSGGGGSRRGGQSG